jgi:16S rRNA (guanine966-N2)-methyltransferase
MTGANRRVRIIGGTARGVRLDEVEAATTRSMTDRVKTSLFGIIDRRLPFASVIDLYAGAGSLGIEALSRGAASCVFADHSRTCSDIIRQNLEKTRLAGRARVLCSDATAAIEILRAEGAQADIVFFDPPFVYGEGPGRQELEQIASDISKHLMTAEALFVYHHERTTSGTLGDCGLTVVDRREYGRNIVTFLRPAAS